MSAGHDDEIVVEAAELLWVCLRALLEGQRDLCYSHGVLEALGTLELFEAPEIEKFAAVVPERLIGVLRDAARRDEPYVVSADRDYAREQRKRAAEARRLRHRGQRLLDARDSAWNAGLRRR